MQIEMRGIDKSFGGNAVLKEAGFLLDHGEIHALMGENGAGKSTLMKILTGVYTKDAGQVIVDGQEVCYKNPQEAEKAGMRCLVMAGEGVRRETEGLLEEEDIVLVAGSLTLFRELA